MKTNKSQKIKKILSLLNGNSDEDYTPKQYVVVNGVCKDKDFKPENIQKNDLVIYMNLDGKEHNTPPNETFVTLNID